MKNRILGFDLARSFAIFGMFIVNFNIVFGSLNDESMVGQFLNLFNGNSSSMFVILAGMGIALMSNRDDYTRDEKRKLRSVVIKRSWFLLITGLLLYSWWPADILHFYGGYLHFAALLLFIPKRFYLWSAAGAVLIFHGLLLVVSYETGWNFETLQYSDFWTVNGFLRNTFYNGWNPILPWIAYFFLGMWLGRLDWQNKCIRQNVFTTGFMAWAFVDTLQLLAGQNYFSEDWAFYINADYIPPFLPFMLGTSGVALMVLVLCVSAGEKFAENWLLQSLTATGQMTLTHYVAHLTLGMIIFSICTGKLELVSLNAENPVRPLFVFIFSTTFFAVSVIFSQIWSRKFKNGPLESVMRKISG